MPESFQYNSPEIELSVLATTGDWTPDDILFSLTENSSLLKKGTLFVRTKSDDTNIVASVVNYSKKGGSEFTICSDSSAPDNNLVSILPSGSVLTNAEISLAKTPSSLILYSGLNEVLVADTVETSIPTPLNANQISAGYLEVGENTTNILLQSQTFSVSPWVKSASVTLTGGQSAPDGSSTATLATGGSGSNFIYQDITLTSGITYTFSIWLKTTGSSKEYRIGLIQGSQTKYTYCSVSPLEWRRFSVTVESTYSGSPFSAYISSSGWDSGETLLLWGAQVEAKPYATSYVATTVAAASSIRSALVTTIDKKVGINTSTPASGLDVRTNAIFRSGVTFEGPLTLSSLNASSADFTSNVGISGSLTVESNFIVAGPSYFVGDTFFFSEAIYPTIKSTNLLSGKAILSEESTNTVKYSTNFYGPAWSFSGLIYGSEITPLPPVEAPDGTMTGYAPEITLTDFYVRQLVTGLSSGQKYSFSVWLKKDSPSRLVTISIRDSSGSTILDSTDCVLTTTWTRFSVSASVTSSSAYIYIENNDNFSSGEKVHIWGPQLEKKEYATGYIPVTGNSSQTAQDTLNVSNLRRVGVNTSNPLYGLDVNTYSVFRSGVNIEGETLLESKLTVNAESEFSGNLKISPGINLVASGTAASQEWSIDLMGQNDYAGNYFHIWSDKTGVGSILAATGDTGRIGIRTSTPEKSLDVNGTALVRSTFEVEGAGTFRSDVSISGSLGIGESASTSPLIVSKSWGNSDNNNVVQVAKFFRRTTNSTVLDGIGLSIDLYSENSSNQDVISASIQTKLNTATSGSEKSEIKLVTKSNGLDNQCITFGDKINSSMPIQVNKFANTVLTSNTTPGTTHSFFLQVLDANGFSVGASNIIKTSSTGFDSKTFNWDAVPGASYYRLWAAFDTDLSGIDINGLYSLISDVTGTSYIYPDQVPVYSGTKRFFSYHSGTVTAGLIKAGDLMKKYLPGIDYVQTFQSSPVVVDSTSWTTITSAEILVRDETSYEDKLFIKATFTGSTDVSANSVAALVRFYYEFRNPSGNVTDSGQSWAPPLEVGGLLTSYYPLTFQEVFEAVSSGYLKVYVQAKKTDGSSAGQAELYGTLILEKLN